MEHTKPKKIKVLLVDDDADDALIVRKMMERIAGHPFMFDWSASFEEAEAEIEAEKHDVYLIDYKLGEKTGLDLLQHIHADKRSQPFILLTGAGDREVEWKSMKLAAADYLVKGSFTPDMLARTLYYALQRKEIEEQRIRHYVDLNRSKDEFISIASHQLRTPATGVKQYIGMLLEGFAGELTPTQMAMLEKAYESNERQLRIVSDLLKVAQVDAGKVTFSKALTDLNILTRDVLSEQKENFEGRHQRVRYIPARGNAVVLLDPDSVRMVLENVIDNAGKYSQEGKTIQIKVRTDRKAVCVEVSDEGVGISKKDQDRLFEKFSRIDNPLSTKVGGTGLGLYWAKKIIDLHDGDITVQSQRGKGTTFAVCLPKKGARE